MTQMITRSEVRPIWIPELDIPANAALIPGARLAARKVDKADRIENQDEDKLGLKISVSKFYDKHAVSFATTRIVIASHHHAWRVDFYIQWRHGDMA